MIQSKDDLYSWFFERRKCWQQETLWANGVFITAKVRRETLCDICQGVFTIEGRSYKIEFENCGGGVYRAYYS